MMLAEVPVTQHPARALTTALAEGGTSLWIIPEPTAKTWMLRGVVHVHSCPLRLAAIESAAKGMRIQGAQTSVRATAYRLHNFLRGTASRRGVAPVAGEAM
jgi:hypothetical protein